MLNFIKVELKECVRGLDIYVVQTAGGLNPNDNLMELLFLINALRFFNVFPSSSSFTPFKIIEHPLGQWRVVMLLSDGNKLNDVNLV